MTPTHHPSDGRTDELQHLLATYLATAPWLRCPGCDGMLVEDVIPGYPMAAAAGAVPNETELIARHPDLAAHIVALFFLLAVAPPVRSAPAADGPFESSAAQGIG